MANAFPVTQATILRHALSGYLAEINKQQPPVGTTAAVALAFRQMAGVVWARTNACARFAKELEQADGLDWSRDELTKAISLLDDWRDRG